MQQPLLISSTGITATSPFSKNLFEMISSSLLLHHTSLLHVELFALLLTNYFGDLIAAKNLSSLDLIVFCIVYIKY